MEKTKRIWAMILVVVIVLGMTPLVSVAETYEDLTYEYSSDSDSITITDCKSTVKGELVIPDHIDGKSVTSIGSDAFSRCTGLTSITIPSSVTNIGGSAFYGCTSLTSINIPSSVTSIVDNPFRCCTGLSSVTVDKNNPVFHNAGNCIIETETKILKVGCKTSVIPSDGSVTSIGDRAFEGCTGLANIMIPECVTSIGSGAFDRCTGLRKITIPERVTEIGSYAFRDCTKLTDIKIPSSATSIGSYAFFRCSSLTDVTISEGVTTLGYDVFSECTSLNSVTIPSSMTSTGLYTFEDCTGLKSVIFSEGVTSIERKAFYGCINLTNITFPSSLKTIGEEAFYDCKSLTDITIPKGVVSIEKSAFAYCSSLKNVVISEGVVTIGFSAFEACGNLTSITIPSSVTTISGCAFYGSALTDIIISEGVASIGGSAFGSCVNLTSIYIPSSVTSIEGGAFSSCSGLISIAVNQENPAYTSSGNCLVEKKTKKLIAGCRTSVIPSDGSVDEIGAWAFGNCSMLTDIAIPKGVTLIRSYAFYYCKGLTSIIIPDGVTSIGFMAFDGCTGLTNISIPSSVKYIDDWAFSGCTGLTSVTLSEGVYKLEDFAFSNCENLTSIVIPSSVESIGWGVFSDSKDLTIYGIAGSYAERYAKEHNISFCEYVSDEDFKFSGASITLYDNLQVNFKVEKALLDKGFTDVYTTFTIDGKTTVVRDYTEDGDYYVFSCSNIRPDQINDKIVATLNGKCLGHTFSAQAEYSISDYCYRMLARCTGAEYAKLRTLLVDLLNYGAASQLYTGHNTASLANATLTGEQKAEATAQVELSTVQNLKAKEIDSPSVSWKGAGLNLKEAIVLRFKIAAESIDGLSVKVESGDGTWTIPSSMFEQTDGGYYVYFNKLNAGQLSDTVYLTVFNGATAVSNTISYSVESYAYAKQNTADEVFKNLLDTMMKYGKSAYEYTH